MLLPILSIIAGLALLVWSAERFIAGASSTARFLGMPPLLIATDPLASALDPWATAPTCARAEKCRHKLSTPGRIGRLTARREWPGRLSQGSPGGGWPWAAMEPCHFPPFPNGQARKRCRNGPESLQLDGARRL